MPSRRRFLPLKFTDTLRRGYACWQFPHLRAFEFYLWPRFWRGRHSWARLNFNTQSQFWRSGESLSGWKLQLVIFWDLFTLIFFSGLIAIGLVAVLSQAVQFWPVLDWPWGGWTLNADAELGYLTTLGQVSAGMLALYFTAISVVASTGYATVPGDIRALIMQNQVGNFYFRVLTLFAATTVVMLAALAFGIALGPLNLLLAFALALLSILSFWVLGKQAFSLFDPATLAQQLNLELHGAITAATAARFGWAEMSLQAHNQRRADRALGSYGNLVAIAIESKNAGGQQLVDLSRALLAVLQFYVAAKARIPSASFWFKRTNKHPDWLLASQHELDIALATDTSLAPAQVPDLNWLEVKAAHLLREIAVALANRHDFANLARLADSLRESMDAFGRNCAIEEGLLVARIAGTSILERCRREDFGTVPEGDLARTTHALAAFEHQCCTFIEVFLGTVRILDELKPAALARRLAQVDWTDERSLYAPGPNSRKVVEQLEELHRCLKFEAELEGQVISPAWLRAEMASRGMVEFLHHAVALILAEVERAFGATPPGAAPHAVIVAENCLWGMEACNKLAKHFQAIQALAAEHAANNRSKEYEWPQTDWAKMQQRITDLRRQLIAKLAACAPALATLPGDGTWPDYFGRSYSVLGDETFDALARGDEGFFDQVFPACFDCAFLAMGRLSQTAGAKTRTAVDLMSPVKDLLDLSGYGLLFSALDGKNYEATVRRCWDARFALLTDPGELAGLMVSLVFIAEPSLWQEPNARLRTRWHYGTDQILRRRGIIADHYGRGHQEEEQVHSNPLVRAYARSLSVLFEAHDIFLSRYLYQRPEAAGLDKSGAIRNFDAEFARENQPASDD